MCELPVLGSPESKHSENSPFKLRTFDGTSWPDFCVGFFIWKRPPSRPIAVTPDLAVPLILSRCALYSCLAHTWPFESNYLAACLLFHAGEVVRSNSVSKRSDCFWCPLAADGLYTSLARISVAGGCFSPFWPLSMRTVGAVLFANHSAYLTLWQQKCSQNPVTSTFNSKFRSRISRLNCSQ